METSGIRIKLEMPTKANIKDILKKLNEELKDKVKVDVEIFVSKAAIDASLSKIRQHLLDKHLSIQIKPFFNQGSLNAELTAIQNKLKQAGIGLGEFKTPLDFTNMQKEMDEIIKRYEKITKMADGYTTKTERTDVTRTGVKEFERTVIDERKKAILEAEKATQETSEQTIKTLKQEKYNVEEITKKYENLKRVVLRKDANFKTRSVQETFLDPNTNVEVTRSTAEGRSTTYRVLDNIHKRKQAELKAQEQIRNALLETERKKREELEKSIRLQEKAIEKARQDNFKFQQQEELRIKRLGDLKKSGLLSSVFEGDYETSRAKLEQYIKSVYGANTSIQKLERTYDSAGKEIWKFNAALESGKNKYIAYKGSIDRTTKSLYEQSKTTEKTLARDLSMFEQFEIAMKRIPIWMAGMTLFYGSLHQVQASIQFISELDKEMTNLKKVTDETVESYQKFANVATELGKSLAKTTVEAVKATTDFAKMGYSLQEAAAFARTALLSANVGDIDITKATQYLIANVKAFNIEAEKSIKIIDVLNALQNQHSTTIEVLGEGLKRTANSMQLAGASFEQTAAMITSVQAVSQRGGEVIGNALRTISFRLRGIDDQTGELIPELEQDLEKVGVKLKNVDGEFRNIFYVLQDLSKIYKNLDSFTQQDLLEKIAGKRQGEILATLLLNFAEAEEALAHATNSYGSALRENEVYMQSIEAKTKQFQVSLEQLYATFLNSDSILGFLSVGQGLIDIFKAMTSTLGGLNTILVLVGTTLFIANIRFREFMLNLTVSPVQAMIVWLNKLSLQLRGIGLSATQATVAIRILQGVTTLGLGLAVGFTLEGVLKLINKIGEASRKQKDYLNQLISTIRDLSDEISNTDSLINKYIELSDKVSLTAEEKSKLIEVTNQLAEAIPHAVEGYDLEGNALSLNIDILREYLDLKRQELDLQRGNLETQFYSDFQNNISELIKKQEELIEKTEKIIRLQETIKKLDPELNFGEIEIFKNKITELSTEAGDLRNEILKLSSDSRAQVEAFLMNTLKDLGIENVNKIIDGIYESLSQMDNINIRNLFQDLAQNEDVINSIKEINDIVEEYKKGNISAEDTQKRVNQQLEILRVVLSNLNTKLKPEIVDNFVNAFKFDDIKNNILTIANVQEDLEKIFEKSFKTVSKYNEILKDIEKGNKVNTDTVRDLISADKDFLEVVEVVNGKLVINEEILYNLIKAKKLEHKQTVATANGNIEVLQIQLAKELNINVKRIQSIKDVASAYTLQAEILAELYNIEQGYTQREVERMKGMAGVTDPRFKALIELGKLIEESQKMSALVGSAGIKSDSKDKDKDLLDQHQTDQYAQSLAELDYQLAKSEYRMSQLNEKSAEYRQEQEKQISLIKQKITLTDQEITRLSNRNSEIQKQLSSLGSWNKLSEEQKKIYNKLNKEFDDNKLKIIQLDNTILDFNSTIRQINQEWKDNLKSLADDIISIYKDVYQKKKEVELNSIQDELDALEDSHRKKIKYFDEELEAYEEIINARLKLIDEQENEEDYQKRLTKAQKERQEIQNKINVLSLDNSIEARQQLFKLNEELTKKDEEIEDLKHDHTIKLRKDNLKNQLDAYKKDIEAKKDIEDEKYRKEKDTLEKMRKEKERYWNDEINSERKYARIRENIFEGNFDNIMNMFDSFKEYIKKHSGEIGESLSQNLIDQIEKFQKSLSNLKSIQMPQMISSSTKSGTPDDVRNWSSVDDMLNNPNVSDSVKDAIRKTREQQGYSGSSGSSSSSSSKSIDIDNEKKYLQNKLQEAKETNNKGLEKWVKKQAKEYGVTLHKGGIVGEETNTPPKIVQLVNKLLNTKGNEQVIKALKNEVFSPAHNITQNFIPNVSKLISSLSPTPVAISNGDRNVNIRIDKVITQDKNSMKQFWNEIDVGLKKWGI